MTHLTTITISGGGLIAHSPHPHQSYHPIPFQFLFLTVIIFQTIPSLRARQGNDKGNFYVHALYFEKHTKLERVHFIVTDAVSMSHGSFCTMKIPHSGPLQSESDPSNTIAVPLNMNMMLASHGVYSSPTSLYPIPSSCHS